MQLKVQDFEDVKVVVPKVFDDTRGYFFEHYSEKTFADLGLSQSFVQDNQSYSKQGVLRGLHLQVGEFAQAKLVSVVVGEVLDVIVDVRKESKTFGKHCSLILSGENKKQLFIPKGFAHGFVVLSEEAIFHYKCDNFYHQASERSIMYNDPQLGIDWKLETQKLLVSDKDLNSLSFTDYKASL